MDIKKPLLCLAIIASLSPALAQADQPSYTFVDGGYLRLDLDDISLDPTGFFIRGSVELAENWFLQAGYLNADDSTGLIDVEIDQFNFGGGFKTAVGEDTSINVTLNYISAEAEASYQYGGSFTEDEDGYGIGAGIRSMLSDSFELNAAIGYSDSGEADGVEFGVGAVWYVFDNIGILVEAASDDDSNRQYMIGGRVRF